MAKAAIVAAGANNLHSERLVKSELPFLFQQVARLATLVHG
jgi:hypothetical protein